MWILVASTLLFAGEEKSATDDVAPQAAPATDAPGAPQAAPAPSASKVTPSADPASDPVNAPPAPTDPASPTEAPVAAPETPAGSAAPAEATVAPVETTVAPVATPVAPVATPVAPVATPESPITPAALPRFRIVDAPEAPGGWQVLDTSDVPVDSQALAVALDDTAALERLQHDRSRARVEDIALVGVGLGAATGGVILLATAGAAVEPGRRPDPLAYGEWSDWRADTDAWEARMDEADQRDERVWTGVTLLTGAALAVGLVPLTGKDARARAEHPALLWERPSLLQRLTPTALVSPASVQLAWVLP